MNTPGWPNDCTFNNQGYSSTPWTVDQTAGSITWETETFAQNQNANAIRWGTLYKFPVRRRSAAASYKRHGRLLQNRIAYDVCYSGACGWWHSGTDTNSYTYSYTKCNSPAYSHTEVSSLATAAPDAFAVRMVIRN